MTIRVAIAETANSTQANVAPVTSTDLATNGLVTLTEPLVPKASRNAIFLNDTYGNAMNQNGSISGTPLGIHNGTDNAYWTGSNIAGGSVTFDSTARPRSGTKSVYVLGPSVTDIWEFNKGSEQALSGYGSISFYINIDRRWGANDSVELYGWDGAAEIGTRVKIEDYFDETIFDTWLQVIIPLQDMALEASTIFGFRMQYVSKSGATPEFFIDDMQLEEDSGGAIEYKAVAPTEKPYYVNAIRVVFADALAGTVASGTMPGLAYDQILGVTLTNGLTFRRFENSVLQSQFTFSDLSDMFNAGFVIKDAISDGTNTCISLEVEFPDPFIIQGSTRDNYLSITVADDLTGLLRFTSSVRGGRVI